VWAFSGEAPKFRNLLGFVQIEFCLEHLGRAGGQKKDIAAVRAGRAAGGMTSVVCVSASAYL